MQKIHDADEWSTPLQPKLKEVVVLGSGGEPLSRCESVAELLKVVYDTIESRSCVCLFSAAYLIGSPAGNGRS